jgi:transposase
LSEYQAATSPPTRYARANTLYQCAEWAIEQQVANFDRKVLELARHDLQVRKFMTAPGVGPITGRPALSRHG